jgi:acetyltransferase-like isoleucine patch superfamily enzyme
MVMKGGDVPSGSIVSAGSIVTKELMYQNCIYAGVPAELKKRDVKWSYSLNEKNIQV